MNLFYNLLAYKFADLSEKYNINNNNNTCNLIGVGKNLVSSVNCVKPFKISALRTIDDGIFVVYT